MTEVVKVTAEAPPLQTDVAHAQDGRGEGHRAAVVLRPQPDRRRRPQGGRHRRQLQQLRLRRASSNGGFNINGSRDDENNITVDGATAIRTRSSGAHHRHAERRRDPGSPGADRQLHAGVRARQRRPDPLRHQERQQPLQRQRLVLPARRLAAGQHLGAQPQHRTRSRTAGRRRSTTSSTATPFGGPIPGGAFKDKLFFFGAQEWVELLPGRRRAPPPCRPRRCAAATSASCSTRATASSRGARTIIDPQTGQPFPGNIIPTDRLSPNGLAFLNAYPLPTPGFRQGSNNADPDQPEPAGPAQGQHPLRLPAERQQPVHLSLLAATTGSPVDAFRGDIPVRAHRLSTGRTTRTTASWTSTLTNNLINEPTYTYSRDDVFINVFTEDGVYQRSRTGSTTRTSSRRRKSSTRSRRSPDHGFSDDRRRPVPGLLRRPDPHRSQRHHLVRGRHTFKAGVSFEYSGEDDFDQINVNAIPGRHQQPERPVRVHRRPRRRGTGLGRRQRRPGPVHQLRRARPAQLHQVARARDRRVRPGLVEADQQPHHRRRRSARSTGRRGTRRPTTSRTSIRASTTPPNAAVISPTTGRLVSGPRYNGVVLPGDGFEGDVRRRASRSNPAILALFRGEPRGFSETHGNVFEPRLGISYSLNDKTVVRASGGVFHNRVTLNDSTLLGGNPPFQPQVTISNGIADNPGGGTVGSADLPFGINGQDPVFKHPTVVPVGDGRAARSAVRLHRRRHLRRPPRALPAARAQHQPAAGGHAPGEPGRQHRRAASVQGLRRHPPLGERRRVDLQQPADQRGSPLHATASRSAPPTRSASRRTTAATSATCSGTPTTTPATRATRVRPPARVQHLLHLRPAVLPRPGHAAGEAARRLADLGRDLLPHRHAVLGRPHQRHRGRGRRRVRPAGRPRRRSRRDSNQQFSYAGPGDDNSFQPGGVRQPGGGHLRQRAAQPALQPGRAAVGHRAVQELRPGRHCARSSSGPRSSTSSTIRTWGRSRTARFRAQDYADPTNANFGRITSKSSDSRDIQLSLRFLF